MAKYTTFIIGMCLAGCTMSPLYQYELPGLERSMPSDVAMTDFVDYDWMGYRVTVEEKLARLGAYSDAPGVIRDGTGKEIRFYRHNELGTPPYSASNPPPPDQLPELKKRFTVIEIKRDPDETPAK
jgi:hypothetical protein